MAIIVFIFVMNPNNFGASPQGNEPTATIGSLLNSKAPQTNMEDLDKKIDQNIQKKEVGLLRQTFYDQLKAHYSSRKYKEVITINCSKKCMKNFREDDLTKTETKCLMNCFNKYYRYLAYSTTLYSYTTNENADDYLFEEEEEKNLMEREQLVELDHQAQKM